MRRLPFAALVLLVALSGCTAEPAPEPIAPATSPALDLVNLWRVTGATSAGDDAYLRLDARELTVWTGCGIGSGSWGSVGSRFVASIWGSSPGAECLPSAEGDVPDELGWLLSADSFRAEGDGFVLVNAEGDDVATLSIDGAPASSPSLADFYVEKPKITDEMRSAFTEPEPLPDTVESALDISGRWTSVQPSTYDRFADFSDATWSASDGCNTTSGRFAIGEGGGYASTGGFSTQIGCENWDGPSWVANAARVGMLDGNLVFFDADATLLGTMTPA